MAKRTPRSHFWALHFRAGDPELAELSGEARRGLAYARELAEHAAERSFAALEAGALASLVPLTVEELAERDFVSPVQVKKEIKRARIELFGKDLSDSAISYRLKKRRKRGRRPCAEPGCEEKIPALAHGRRRYCDAHASPAARVRRHREGTAGPARPPRRYKRRPRSDEPNPLVGLSPAQLERLQRVIFGPQRARRK